MNIEIDAEMLSFYGGILFGFGTLTTFWLLIVPFLLSQTKIRVRGIVRRVEKVGEKLWIEASYSDPIDGELRVTDRVAYKSEEELVPGYSHVNLSFFKFLWYRKAMPENTRLFKYLIIMGMFGLACLTAGAAFLYEGGITSYDLTVVAMCLGIAIISTAFTFTILLCGVDITLTEYETGEQANLLVNWEQMPSPPIIPYIPGY